MSAAFYQKPFAPLGYDVASRLVFAPCGGLAALRAQALEALSLRPGDRVLELGCGTGGITRRLVAAGARVHAIDASPVMLARARRRAPAARFECCALESLTLSQRYECVVFAFVLHEMPAPLRARALESAVAALVPGGLIAVLDHALPMRPGLARAWRALLLRLEPATVVECIERGYGSELEAAGARVVALRTLAGGTAALTLARS